MKNLLLLPASLWLGLTLLSTHAYSAEPASKRALPGHDAVSEPVVRLPDFQADGLPLSEIGYRLGQHFTNVNFVVPEQAANETVSVKLRAVTLDDILKAMELSTVGRVRVIRQGDNLVSFAVASAGSRQNQVVCRVFSLSAYLGGRSEKEATIALQGLFETLDVAWSMLKEASPDDGGFQRPKLNIHPGTKLLIAVGREKELAVIEQVAKELQGSVSSTTIPVPADNEARSKTTGTPPTPAGRR